MRALNIYDDHVIRDPDFKVKHPPIDGLSLSRFADVAIRVAKYNGYLRRTQRITLRKSTDYDGYPFEDFHEILYNANDDYTTSDPQDLSINVVFQPTTGGDFDYTAIAGRNTTTAYKRGRIVDAKETRFKVHSAQIRRKEASADVWAQRELARLTEILDRLDQSTQSLRSWAEDGINMQVFCSTARCRWGDKAILSSEQLLIYANKGLSLDDLRKKLKCKKCGAQCSDIGTM